MDSGVSESTHLRAVHKLCPVLGPGTVQQHRGRHGAVQGGTCLGGRDVGESWWMSGWRVADVGVEMVFLFQVRFGVVSAH